MSAPTPSNELTRLSLLQAYEALDTEPEPEFDDIAQVAAALCGVPIACVSLVDDRRQWFKARVGIDLVETPRDIAICAYTISGTEVFEVPDLAADPRFTDSPLVTGPLALRFYAGAPLLIPDGYAVGTVLVLDTEPHQLTPTQRQGLVALARQAVRFLELRRRSLENQRSLLHHAEAALGASDAQYRAIVEMSTDLIARITADGTLRFVNQKFCDRIGRPRELLLGSSFFELLPAEGRTTLRQYIGSPSPQSSPCTLEHHRCSSTGDRRWLHWEIVPVPASDGQRELQVVGQDVTDRIRAEETVRQSEARFRAIVEDQTEFVVRWRPDGTRTFVNEPYRRYFGLSDAEAVGNSFMPLIAGEEAREKVRQNVAHLTPTEPVLRHVHRAMRADGALRWQEWIDRGVFDARGLLIEIQSVGRDIHDQRVAEEQLADLQRFNQRVLDIVPSVVYVHDLVEQRNVFINREVTDQLGFSQAELDEMDHAALAGLMHPEDVPEFQLHLARSTELRDGEVTTFEYRMRRSDGSWCWMLSRDTVFARDAGGLVTQIIGVATDITDRKDAIDALAEAQRFNERVLEVMPCVLFIYDVEKQQNVLANREVPATLGYTAEQLPSVLQDPVEHLMHPDDRPRFAAHIGEVFQLADGEAADFIYRMRHQSGQWRWFHGRDAVFSRIANGEIKQLIGTATDITAIKNAEAEARVSNERYQELAAAIDEVFWISSPDKNEAIYVSPAYATIWGLSCESLYEDPHSWLASIHPDDRARVAYESRHNQRTGGYNEEFRIVRPDGELRWIHDRAYPIRNDSGEVIRIVGVAQDVTTHRHLEEQVRHLQKMESIGQLAAGVAHDFNNLLTVILGNVELLRRSWKPDALQEIAHAAARAADLTGQLLLFSRRAEMRFQSVDLTQVIGSSTKMLSRILGEHIELDLQVAEEVPSINADPGMIEQVVVNLAVNARDAMPGGGRLQLTTFECHVTAAQARQNPESSPGWYVCLVVTDTGEGITAADLPKIFDPFFTTKAVGKGTGLGLSTVYGIIKQHDGWIEVESKCGSGTSFLVYLPVRESLEPQRPIGGGDWVDTPPTGVETVLVVEDDPAVLGLASRILRLHGYRVFTAASGPDALELWTQHRDEIALVLTDVVMPGGMTGVELAARMRRDRPKLRIVYTSGYTREWNEPSSPLRERENFLRKPYRTQALLELVRRCLDHPGSCAEI